MDFFESQAGARRKTVALLAMFIFAIIGMALASNLILVLLDDSQVLWEYRWLLWEYRWLLWDYSPLLDYMAASKPSPYLQTREFGPMLSIIVAGTIILASLIRLFTLRRGGAAIAEMLNGELLTDPGGDPDKRKLLHLVSEMAIASGTPEPPVYLLRDSAINAFAAGFRPEDAVIGVTTGAIEQLNRDELQGVIGHEFSHILNGDMRINIRLICVNFGLNVIGWIGFWLLIAAFCTLLLLMAVFIIFFLAILAIIVIPIYYAFRDPPGSLLLLIVPVLALMFLDAVGVLDWLDYYITKFFQFAVTFIVLPGLLVAPGLLVMSGLGKFFGKMLNAAVSRQREYLADASAVQFTRNPAGIAGALKRIGGYECGSVVSHPKSDIVSHAFFCQAVTSAFAGLFATHPPLTTRIREIEPGVEWRLSKQ